MATRTEHMKEVFETEKNEGTYTSVKIGITNEWLRIITTCY